MVRRLSSLIQLFNQLPMVGCSCVQQLTWQCCVVLMVRFAIPSKYIYYLILKTNTLYDFVFNFLNMSIIRYGSYPLKGKYCHEMALRILLASIEVIVLLFLL